MAGSRTVGTTQHRKKAFLEAYARTGVVAYAAQAAGVDRSLVYLWKAKDPTFLVAYAQAEEGSTERLETEAFRRAHDGTPKPVYQGGEQVGTIQEYSDTLLIFLLKARRPHVYRDRVDVQATVTATVDATVTAREAVRAHLSDADVDRFTRALLGADEAAETAG